MKKAALFTLGCRVNQYETEAMTELFTNSGYEIVNFDDYADVYIINTCTVTNMGDRKSRQMIRKAKKTNPDAVIAVAGCYAQVAPDEVAKIPGVDVVVGASNKSQIVELTEKFLKNNTQIVDVDNIMKVRGFENLEINEYYDRTRAFLKIQDGCDRFCTYCLIPYARGPVRSKSPESILSEVKRVAENNYKEVILSGIHVASYGKDLNGVTLMDIIEKINEVNGIERIRIGSIDPTFFKPGVIERLCKVKKFCPHFHLSLQSGCNETLERMNRHYTTEEYKGIVELIRNHFDDASITTDLIVGFPGETEEEFNRTVDFINDIEFSKIHVFKYSPRKGTKAAEFQNQIKPEIKEKRSDIILKIDGKLEKKFIQRFKDKTKDVLFEEYHEGYAKGYTKNYIRVKTKSDTDISGDIRFVIITGIEDTTATSELI